MGVVVTTSGDDIQTYFSHSNVMSGLRSDGGIRLGIARKAWLTTWHLVVHLDEGTCSSSGCVSWTRNVGGNATLGLLADELPRWTHVSVVKAGSELRVIEDTHQVATVSDESIGLFRGRSLSGEVFLGGDRTSPTGPANKK